MPEQRQLVAVIGLAKDADGRILLQKRIAPLIPTADGKWELPGGRVEFGESPEAAVIRECEEEIGCIVRVKRLIPVIQSTRWLRDDDVDLHVFVICYEVEIVSGVPQPMDDKVSEVGWFTKDEAKTMDLLRGVEEYIDLC